jgi:WD40 repeat protein
MKSQRHINEPARRACLHRPHLELGVPPSSSPEPDRPPPLILLPPPPPAAAAQVEQVTRLCGPNLEHCYRALKVTGPAARASCCCFCAEGVLATGGYGTTVQLWSADTGAHQSSLAAGAKRPNSCFDPGGELLVAWGGPGQLGVIEVVELSTQRTKRLADGHSCAVKCCAVSADRQRVLSCDEAGGVVLWEVGALFKGAAGEARHQRLGQHADKVKCCALSLDGLLAATGR